MNVGAAKVFRCPCGYERHRDMKVSLSVVVLILIFDFSFLRAPFAFCAECSSFCAPPCSSELLTMLPVDGHCAWTVSWLLFCRTRVFACLKGDF